MSMENNEKGSGQNPGTKRSFDVAFLAGKDDDFKSAFRKVAKKSETEMKKSDSFAEFRDDDETKIKLQQSRAATNPVGNCHFPALRKLLDVRNSIQSLEEDPTLEDAVIALNEDKNDKNGGPGLSHASATAMASLLSSPLLFPLTPTASASLTPTPSGVPDMSAGLAALLLPSPSAASLSGIVPSNTCAICGVTFRMTSDLVYHMRTHHAKSAAESR